MYNEIVNKKGGISVNILANILSGAATRVADTGASACAFYFFDEPTTPEEIL